MAVIVVLLLCTVIFTRL